MNTKHHHIRTLFMLLSAATALTAAAQPDSTRLKEQQIDEVVVRSNTAQRRIGSLQIGAEQMSIKELTATPALFGEADIMRSVQLLPGVKAESDASSSFQVRGGTSAQNSILYDDAPVFNVGHLAGLFSAFNDEALASATLYKGLLPAQYGGASSAVMDITARTGSMSEWHGGGSIGLLSAKGCIEGPIARDRLSVLATARRSYMDVFLKQMDDFRGNTLYFYDTNMKLHWKAGEHDNVQLSLFMSRDRTAMKDLVDMEWKNLALSLSYLHSFANGSHAQTSLFFSNYSTDNAVDLLGMNLRYASFIRQGGLRQHLLLKVGRQELNIGAQSTVMDVKSAEWRRVSINEREERRAWDNNAWVHMQLTLSPRLSLAAGLRLNAFSILGGPYYYDIDGKGNITWVYTSKKNEVMKPRITWEPRLSMVWQPKPTMSVKAGYTRTVQNLHALRSQSTSTPFDRYTMSSNIVKPQIADQLSAGLFLMTPNEDYGLSVEGYYRHVDNVLDYRDGVSFASEIEIERLVLPGEGRAYGAELCLRKNTGRLTGWVAYTLAWSENRIDGISQNQWYTANNDRRHDVDIVVSYRLNRHWTLNALWVYNSGQAFTAPSAKYELIDNYIYYYSERNGYRAPAYHRMDIGATWSKKLRGGKLTREWNFGIYNLYNRYNPFIINFEDSNNGARTKAVQYSLFGIVPSVSFALKF